MVALRAGTRCACGEVMYPHQSRKVLVCTHCDASCEIANCPRCRGFQIGSRVKNDSNWNPAGMYTEHA